MNMLNGAASGFALSADPQQRFRTVNASVPEGVS
jgi:hypothetical protein